ncbi:unnamed protein product [Owenia fusiformis]|uniref:Uncharacterized protein n=1 Tax=Owenia fusiformis TaxID=6347 RepID=A0A8S4NF78_OWEFU|nr:unnamed protein product [Owenia fusiformis]
MNNKGVFSTVRGVGDGTECAKMATAKQDKSDPLVESVTCSICMEILDDPRSLQCMHSYCRKCIQVTIVKHQDKKLFPCPICREDCPITNQGAAGLKVNFFVNSVLDIAKDQSALSKDAWNCDICLDEDESVPAISKCLDCNEKLCKACNRAHKRSRCSKLHKILELSGDTSKDTKAAMDMLSRRTLYCQVHTQEPLKYFCKKDQLLICQDCFAFDHQGHQLENIEQTAKANLKYLNSIIDLGRQRSAKYEESISDGHAQKLAVEKRTEKSKTKLVTDRRIVLAHVNAYFDKLESELTAAGNASVKTLITHLANLEFDKDAIDGTVKQLEALQDHGHPADIVSMIPEMNAKREVWSMIPDLQLEPDQELQVKTPSKLNDANLKLASLEDRTRRKAHKVAKGSFENIIVLANDDVVTITSDKVKFYDKNLGPRGKMINVPKGWQAVSKSNDNCVAFCYQQNNCIKMRTYNDDGHIVTNCHIPNVTGLKDFVINQSDEVVMVDDDDQILRVKYKSGKMISSRRLTNLSSMAVCNLDVNSKADVIMSHKSCISIIRLRGKGAGKREVYTARDNELGLVAYVDKQDNIIVLNQANSTITILTPEGEFIKDLITPTKCKPFSLHPNSEGDLVVGAFHKGSAAECMFILRYRSEDGNIM